MRTEGWESRLTEMIEDAIGMPYEIGVHDCALWVCQVVEEITGVDHSAAFRGRYSTARESLCIARQIAGGCGGLREAVSVILDVPERPPQHINTGDPLLWIDDEGVEHLGISAGGHRMALLTASGLEFIPLYLAECGWRT